MDRGVTNQAAVDSARNTLEREMFSYPEDAPRYLELLDLIADQKQDDAYHVRQRFSGHWVLSLDALMRLEDTDSDGNDDLNTWADTYTGWGENRPRHPGRDAYLETLAAFFDAAAKRVAPKPRQNLDRFHAVLREISYDRRSVREVGKEEGVGHDAVVHRRKRAIAQLVASVADGTLEGVARELVWFMKANNVNPSHLPEWVRQRVEVS